jgi:hypothetical protein
MGPQFSSQHWIDDHWYDWFFPTRRLATIEKDAKGYTLVIKRRLVRCAWSLHNYRPFSVRVIPSIIGSRLSQQKEKCGEYVQRTFYLRCSLRCTGSANKLRLRDFRRYKFVHLELEVLVGIWDLLNSNRVILSILVQNLNSFLSGLFVKP